MSEKPYHEMDEAELRAAKETWAANVDQAAGWPSAYFAAKQLEAICKLGERRGLDGFNNPFPIKRG